MQGSKHREVEALPRLGFPGIDRRFGCLLYFESASVLCSKLQQQQSRIVQQSSHRLRVSRGSAEIKFTAAELQKKRGNSIRLWKLGIGLDLNGYWTDKRWLTSESFKTRRDAQELPESEIDVAAAFLGRARVLGIGTNRMNSWCRRVEDDEGSSEVRLHAAGRLRRLSETGEELGSFLGSKKTRQSVEEEGVED